MAQKFGFEVERNHEVYVFTDNPEICPDCGGESVIPIGWEKIHENYWQVDRLCTECDKPINSTFLNEKQIADYDNKLAEMEIKAMLNVPAPSLDTQPLSGPSQEDIGKTA